jgi:hypothetical protein
VSLARVTDASATWSNTAGGTKHVTIKDSTLTYNASTGAAAGIFIGGEADTYPVDITIEGNTITAEGTAAAQGIFVKRYTSSVRITRNTLTGTTSFKHAEDGDAPGSALLIQIHPGQVSPSANPADFPITGNELSGTHFNFYVSIACNNSGNGIDELWEDKFGTSGTKWATGNSDDGGSFYKQLLNSLVSQVNGSPGFGRFYMSLAQGVVGATGMSAVPFALEYYEIGSYGITAINYWSPGIDSGSYNTITDMDDETPTEMAALSTATHGRLILDLDDGWVPGASTEGNFKWLINGPTTPSP